MKLESYIVYLSIFVVVVVVVALLYKTIIFMLFQEKKINSSVNHSNIYIMTLVFVAF